MPEEDEFGYEYDCTCHECNGAGFIIVCIDDLCHGAGYCIHGDGEVVCKTCKGSGEAA
jgi:hypothetical protein